MTTTSLESLQRWMQAVIVHPQGIDAGIKSPAAQAELPLRTDDLESLICPSATQSARQRLEVYSHAYLARLLEVLAGDYPAVAQAIGDDALAALAAAYLELHPPSSYTLSHLGKAFPDYLSGSRPPRLDDEPDWADFLIDLARLERIYSEVFDGPGIEGQATLSADSLKTLTADQWSAARLVVAPCVRLATFQFPVHLYASAVRNSQAIEFPAATMTRLIITRRDWIVRREAIDASQSQVLHALFAGASIAQALQQASPKPDESLEDFAATVRGWFHRWAVAGYFTAVDLPDTLDLNRVI